MKLTYGQLELTLASHLQIHPDKVPTFRSRLKQLQRLQFPPGVNVGRGAKMEYSGEHLFMLVTAFELISFGLPAQTACNAVTDHWAQFGAGYALAALQDRDRSYNSDGTDANPGSQILAVVSLQALHEIQFDRYFDPSASTVQICDELAIRTKFERSDTNRRFTRLVMSLGDLLKRVLQIASEQAGVTSAIVWDKDFHAWLPKEVERWIIMKTPYPDRSNIEQRKFLNQFFGGDDECQMAEGVEKARQYAANGYSDLTDD